MNTNAKNQTGNAVAYGEYFRHFALVPANDEVTRKRAYAVRHAVFCKEKGWRDVATETDRFDAVARHALLVDREHGTDIGTARVVVPTSAGGRDAVMPTQELTRAPVAWDIDVVSHAVEVSRICILGSFRRQGRDNQLTAAKEMCGMTLLLPLGLFQFVIRVALQSGRPMLLGLMTQAFLRQLTRVGIHFVPIDAPIELEGLRYPCLLPDLLTMFDDMRRINRCAWEIVSNCGELHEQALAVRAASGVITLPRVLGMLPEERVWRARSADTKKT